MEVKEEEQDLLKLVLVGLVDNTSILGVLRAPRADLLPHISMTSLPVVHPPKGAGLVMSEVLRDILKHQSPQSLPRICLAAVLSYAALTACPSVNCFEEFSLGASFCTSCTNIRRWMKNCAHCNGHFVFEEKSKRNRSPCTI